MLIKVSYYCLSMYTHLKSPDTVVAVFFRDLKKKVFHYFPGLQPIQLKELQLVAKTRSDSHLWFPLLSPFHADEPTVLNRHEPGTTVTHLPLQLAWRRPSTEGTCLCTCTHNKIQESSSYTWPRAQAEPWQTADVLKNISGACRPSAAEFNWE